MTDVLGLLPFVPSGKDFEKSRALLKQLGFQELWSAEGGLLARRASLIRGRA